MARKGVRVAGFALLILLPFLLPLALRHLGGLPAEIAFATGPEGGRYRTLSESIGRRIEQDLGISLRLLPSDGSLQNLDLLDAGEADFALYEPGTWEALEGECRYRRIRSVATLYRQPVFLVVSLDSGIRDASDLRGRIVDLGLRASGDHALALTLLDHLGLPVDQLDPRHLDYEEALSQLRSGALDAAFVSLEINTPVLDALIKDDATCLLDIPFPEALTQKSLHLSRYQIPAGFFQVVPRPIPPRPIETVAASAELLTRDGVSAQLVEGVARIVHDQAFLRSQNLRDLWLRGTAFSRARLEFPIHPGALHYYEPQSKPLMRPELIDATESLRSFLASLIIAAVLAIRWIRQRMARRQEHRIDRYIRALLDIERRQVALDAEPGARDLPQLQRLLDEVTDLRQEALGEFSAHELREDRGVDCFVQMCHALSDKINAKITRQRLCRLGGEEIRLEA